MEPPTSLVTLHQFARKQRRLIITLVWTLAITTATSSAQTPPGEPNPTLCLVYCRRRRPARTSPTLGLRGICTVARVGRALAAARHPGPDGPRHGFGALDAGDRSGARSRRSASAWWRSAWGRPSSPRLVRWALELNRLATFMFFWSVAIILNQVMGHRSP